MNVVDEHEYVRRWTEAPGAANGPRRLALNAVIGEFIGNAGFAEHTTRKIARDIVRQSELTCRIKGEAVRYKDAPLGDFEDSMQVVGKPYRSPRIAYAALLGAARKTLRRFVTEKGEQTEAKAYLLARLKDADLVRKQRNVLAHSPVLWFTGRDKATVLDRRLSHNMSDMDEKTVYEEPTVEFEKLFRGAVLADRLGKVGAEEAVWRLWPDSCPPHLARHDRSLEWPPEAPDDGPTRNQEEQV
ncbi:MAG: hypothetical protein ACK5LO_02655 [Leucobacter sp.]